MTGEAPLRGGPKRQLGADPCTRTSYPCFPGPTFPVMECRKRTVLILCDERLHVCRSIEMCVSVCAACARRRIGIIRFISLSGKLSSLLYILTSVTLCVGQSILYLCAPPARRLHGAGAEGSLARV